MKVKRGKPRFNIHASRRFVKYSDYQRVRSVIFFSQNKMLCYKVLSTFKHNQELVI